MSTPSSRAASITFVPFGTAISRPSMLTVTRSGLGGLGHRKIFTRESRE
jgi:hypothetical protein